MTHDANPTLRVAFLGMGRMGTPMAQNVANGGFPVTIWNRTPAKAAYVRSDCLEVATEASEAVDLANVVITMLTDGESVRDVLFDHGVADAMTKGSIFVDMSSIPPSVAIDHEQKLRERGVECLDAPVSGGTRGAEAGSLTILVGGSATAFAESRAVIETMGRATHVGPAASGQIAKLANQIIVAAAIGGVAEAFLLVAASGLDLDIVLNALAGGFADSRVLNEHGRRMITRDFEAGGAVALHLKDMETALLEAGSRGLRLPLSEEIATWFQSLVDSGDGDSDHSALLLELERINASLSATAEPHSHTRLDT